jgi:hypothetical protein
LTFKLLRHYALADEHNPAGKGHLPGSKRVEGPTHRAGIAAKTVATASATCRI